jgi:hypothetical protein
MALVRRSARRSRRAWLTGPVTAADPMPVCKAAGCEHPVPRPYEHARQRAEQLRRAADDLMAEAEQRAANMRSNADEDEAQAEQARRRDDFPLCGAHERLLSLESAGQLIATAGTDNRALRKAAIQQALEDLKRGARSGRSGERVPGAMRWHG